MSSDSILHCSLLRNPVIHKPSYRHYVIYAFPQLRVLDFRRIKQKVSVGPVTSALLTTAPQEREKAASMFKGKKGEEKLQSLQKKANT